MAATVSAGSAGSAWPAVAMPTHRSRPVRLALYRPASATSMTVSHVTARGCAGAKGNAANPTEQVRVRTVPSGRRNACAAMAARIFSASSRPCSRSTKRSDDEELLAAPAHQVVRGAEHAAQHGRRLHQHGVAGRVAIRVVDALEMIEIEQQEHEIALAIGSSSCVRADGKLDVAADRLLEEASVAQPGQRIGEARFLDACVARLAAPALASVRRRAVRARGFAPRRRRTRMPVRRRRRARGQQRATRGRETRPSDRTRAARSPAAAARAWAPAAGAIRALRRAACSRRAQSWCRSSERRAASVSDPSGSKPSSR